MWSAPTQLLEVDIDALAMKVAENVSMQAMSRMCRKGMGFRRTDDRRLRNAEHRIAPETEIAKIADALGPVETAEAPMRPANLWVLHKALERAWHRWRETDLTTAHAANNPSGCLGEPWYHEYEAPSTYGLAERLARLWLRTLCECWGAGKWTPSAVPNLQSLALRALPEDVAVSADVMASAEASGPPPFEWIRALVLMPPFMAEVRKLDDARYGAVKEYLLQQAIAVQAAEKAAKEEARRVEQSGRARVLSKAAKERAKAHREHLGEFRATPPEEREDELFAIPGCGEDDCCWQCCGGDARRSVQLLEGEESTPLRKMKQTPDGTGRRMDDPILGLPGGAGGFVAYCDECYYERCESLDIDPSEDDEDDDQMSDDEEDEEDWRSGNGF